MQKERLDQVGDLKISCCCCTSIQYSELVDCGWAPHRIAEANLIDLKIDHALDTIDRISAAEVTIEEFIKRYEAPGIPVIITDVTDNWNAHKKWTIPVRRTIVLVVKAYSIAAPLSQVQKPKV